ncbi:MAG TPA: nucleotide-binding domain containing protein, partial [Rubrivivax sp.]
QSWWRRADRQPLLVLGASSVAQALIAAWPHAFPPAPAPAEVKAATGPVFVLAGSLSPVTAAQVAAAGAGYQQVTLDAASLTGSEAALNACASACASALAAGASVLAVTSAPGAGALPAADVARACGRLLAAVLVRSPQVRRVGVAGGDTSSWALRALAPWALQWAGSLSPGVALLRARATDARIDGLELALKGGQMGPPDVFDRLLHGTR